jgi:hypothetical protein
MLLARECKGVVAVVVEAALPGTQATVPAGAQEQLVAVRGRYQPCAV